ncbi:hypothetical protein GCM10009799_29840 [Nocardiopsis rhodophaea]|uniref:Class I SAM-dependent methyltransferase n=1 Tax=Nocardiopsis rhodophaea TaxID=280238 RepID=A0ABN2T735_9ACTN
MRTETTLPACKHASDAGDPLPGFAFDPSDPWTRTFQEGLEGAGLADRSVYEVGIGSGANIVHMLERCGAGRVTGSDLDPRLPLLAQRVVERDAPGLAHRFRPVPGAVSLIDTREAAAAMRGVDAVVACLPQVPDPLDTRCARFCAAYLGGAEEERCRVDDRIAHYYPWSHFDALPYNAVGLGLIEALLRQVRSCAPRARIVLNFGCRVGRETLSGIFRANGYRPTELVARVVRQSECTGIGFFAALEEASRGPGEEPGFVCEFYADPQGRSPLTAIEAKRILDADPAAPVYHEVCVVQGDPAE